MMTLRQIEAFRAVMITGSVTQAAERLFVSQPAVSRMVSDLELEVGFKLFKRQNRQLIPTDEGQALYREVEQAFIGLDQINKAAGAIREYRSGQLRLITIPSLAPFIVADLVARFTRAYPNVAVSLEVQPSQRVFEWLVSQQCDLGITTLLIDNPAIEARPIMSGESVCVLPAGHPLAKRKVVKPRDLAGADFISYKSDSIMRHLVDEIFDKAGVVRRLKLEARTTEAICGLVAAGLGVSLIGPAFPANGVHDRVVTRRFRPAIPIDLMLLHPTHKPRSRIAESFIAIVDAYVAAAAGKAA